MIVFSSFVYAIDIPEVAWEKFLSDGEAESGQQTLEGGYIVVVNIGGDVLLIKTDSNGDQEWNRTYGGNESDKGYSMQQTSDQGYIIAGYTYSYGTSNPSVYLIKTDFNGNLEWNRTLGYGVGYSVHQTSDGGYIITGRQRTTSDYDVYLIKTDLNGIGEWNKTFGSSTENDIGRSVKQTIDGGYIITGQTDSSSLLMNHFT